MELGTLTSTRSPFKTGSQATSTICDMLPIYSWLVCSHRSVYYLRYTRYVTSRDGSGQPGDIQFPNGAQLFEGRLSSSEHVRRWKGRKNRVLEELPIAPPLEPRQPTAAGLALQEVNDQRTIELLKYRLRPILTELKRKYRRYCARASCSYNHLDFSTLLPRLGMWYALV
ncbi:hypothetical protein JOM56_014770 [Amanita muscaria]